jgi:hypothetical protein
MEQSDADYNQTCALRGIEIMTAWANHPDDTEFMRSHSRWSAESQRTQRNGAVFAGTQEHRDAAQRPSATPVDTPNQY